MAITLYELVGAEDRRFSPYCWRTRFALAHKGLDYETVPVRFGDKSPIAFSDQERVPVITDGDKTVNDSWAIATYLEDAYPDRPSLFGGTEARALAQFINLWADQVVTMGLITLIVRDVFDRVHPDDREYFLETREKRFGKKLDAVQEDRDERLPAVRAALAPARTILSQRDWLSGAAPAYADYILAGTFQWARMTSPYAILEGDDAIVAWHARMRQLFDGLAEKAPVA